MAEGSVGQDPIHVTTARSGGVRCAIASAPLPGLTVSGDTHVFRAFPGGVLVAVIDALGHGPEAEAVAGSTAEVLRRGLASELADLVHECHSALAGGRGAVMSLASITPGGLMTWLGVGNVDGTLLRVDGPRVSLVSRAGIVGARLPTLRPQSIGLVPGDRLLMTTDGIRDGESQWAREGDIAAAALRLMTVARRHTDDALVLVAEFLGSRGPGASG